MSEIQKSEIINPETMGLYMAKLMSAVGDLGNAMVLIQNNLTNPMINDYQSGGNAEVYYGEAIDELAVFSNSLAQNVGRLTNLVYTLYQYMAQYIIAARLTDEQMKLLLETSFQQIEVNN